MQPLPHQPLGTTTHTADRAVLHQPSQLLPAWLTQMQVGCLKCAIPDYRVLAHTGDSPAGRSCCLMPAEMQLISYPQHQPCCYSTR